MLFNFGWLPGAEHDIHSTADGSVPALRAALDALRPGGVLAAVLYGGMAWMGSGLWWDALGCGVPILVSGFMILCLYNGQRAAHGRNFYKWFFYIFYPAHLLALGLLRICL